MTLLNTLAGWLEFIERQHPDSIALGLERVARVRERMQIDLSCPVVTVGGTNGKGSTCAMLEGILRAGGYRTGVYTSPHLLRYNERVRIESRDANDTALCEAFAAVERAREGTALTYFEFGTLAAAWLFSRERLDVVVLEVGLGGRLDAVNVFDTDCAVLTSIGIDHVEYLGGTREQIGREKAGIFRGGRPAIVADPTPPATVLEEAERVGAAPILLSGRDYGYGMQPQPGQWAYWGPTGKRAGLAFPALRGAIQVRNAAAALTALGTLRERLPLSVQALRRGLADATLPGRFQLLPGLPGLILDVAHNPQAAAVVRENLAALRAAARTIAVVGMLRDKDIVGVLRTVAPLITQWHLVTLNGPRGATAAELAQALRAVGVKGPWREHRGVAPAFAAARDEAGEDDKILVFGSFVTVAEVMQEIESSRSAARGHG